MSNKKAANRRKSRKGNKRYFGSQKLTTRETNFRIWLEREEHVPYHWYRTLPVYSRNEFKTRWYEYLEKTGKSPTKKLPAKHR